MSELPKQPAQMLEVKELGVQPYDAVWAAMKNFTDTRTEETIDQLWLVQHLPVFTQGQAGKAEHILASAQIPSVNTLIPIVQTDRGGQVTYHGPGQLVAYPLLNLKRLNIGVRELVTRIEHSIVNTLADFSIQAYADPKAPGVYVDRKKIASLGLRVRRGCSFHGLSLNVDMDLSPFLVINPCGYQGLEMTQMKDQMSSAVDFSAVQTVLVKRLAQSLDLNAVAIKN